MNHRKCRFCRGDAHVSGLVQYGVRHYAHLDCGLIRHGVAFFENFTLNELMDLPYLPIRKAGLEPAYLVIVKQRQLDADAAALLLRTVNFVTPRDSG